MKEIITYRGVEIKIDRDENAESPDAWGNTDYFIVYDHRQFYIKRDGFDPSEIFEHIEKTRENIYNGYHVFILSAYIHSGVSLSLGSAACSWDTSMSGFVLVSQEFWNERDEAEKIAKGLIENWNTYLEGDVWCYNSEYGSCCGFYGDYGKEQMIKEAKAEIDYAYNRKVKKTST